MWQRRVRGGQGGTYRDNYRTPTDNEGKKDEDEDEGRLFE